MSDAPARLTITEISPTSAVLTGEIDAHTAPQIAAHFDGLAPDTDRVELDLAAVNFMDSSGLRVVIELNNRISGGGGTLVLQRPSRSVARLLEISGLLEHFTVEQG